MSNFSENPEAPTKHPARIHRMAQHTGAKTEVAQTGSHAQSTSAHKATKPVLTGQPGRLQLDRVATPIGAALLVTDEAGVLRALDFHDHEPRMLRLLRSHYGSLPLPGGAAPKDVKANLLRYFEGELDALRNIAWATAGTQFQRSVWNALVDIAPGQTRGYGELARILGNPNASRAVGLANGSNPIAIIVPCHRVIGASGKLTGYASGLHRKDWLLRHEGARFAAVANRDLFRI